MSCSYFAAALLCAAFAAVESSCYNSQISLPEPVAISNQIRPANFVSSCGPSPRQEAIRPLKTLVLPPVEGPIFPLPAPAPPKPTIINNKCACTKTVLKPQLYQRLIQTQKNQRFLRKSFRPVVEKVQYDAHPRC